MKATEVDVFYFEREKLERLNTQRLKNFKKACHAAAGHRFIDTCGCDLRCYAYYPRTDPERFSEATHNRYKIYSINMDLIIQILKGRKDE